MEKIFNFLQKAWFWIVWSSKNPEQFSLTLKGFIPLISLLGVGDIATLEMGIDSFQNILFTLVAFGSALVGFYGICRKIYNSVVKE